MDGEDNGDKGEMIKREDCGDSKTMHGGDFVAEMTGAKEVASDGNQTEFVEDFDDDDDEDTKSEEDSHDEAVKILCIALPHKVVSGTNVHGRNDASPILHNTDVHRRSSPKHGASSRLDSTTTERDMLTCASSVRVCARSPFSVPRWSHSRQPRA